MRTAPVLLSAVLLAGASLPAAGAPAHAATACVDTGGSYDFNGDGRADRVAGDPGATVNGVSQAGRIAVRYGKTGDGFGATTTIAQGSAPAGEVAESSDHFGQTLAVGLIDGDECADVVVGVPGEKLDDQPNVGQVEVLFGSAKGLGGGRATWTMTGRAIGGLSDAGFGSALAVASEPDRTGDGDASQVRYAQVAIGVPELTVDKRLTAGAVVLLDFDATGAVDKSLTITQNTAGVAGTAESNDRFGSSLVFGSFVGSCTKAPCQDLVVGVPGENDGAGAVQILDDPLTAATQKGTVLTQATAGMAGAAEAGDGFGSVLAADAEQFTGVPRVAVGIPGEDVGSAADAGSVQLLRFADGKLYNSVVSQASAGIAGTAEAGDRFGSSLAFGNVQHQFIELSLLVGVPGEDVGSVRDVGGLAAMVVTPTEARGSDDTFVTQDSAGVPGKAEAGERFGSVLSPSGLIGVPDDKGYAAGVVLDVGSETLFGLSKEAGTAWTAWTVSGGSRFGAAVG